MGKLIGSEIGAPIAAAFGHCPLAYVYFLLFSVGLSDTTRTNVKFQ